MSGRVAFLLALVLLPGCSMALQPQVSLNKQADPYPSDYVEISRRELDPFDNRPDLVSGQLSSPSVAAESMFGPRRWYVCHRSKTGVETVIFIIGGRGETIPGPSPYFCDNKVYQTV